MSLPRARIVAAARSWIGTPYHHQGSLRGVGTDCLGLVRGLHRDLLGCEPEPPPAYTRDWAEAAGAETLLAAARRHLVEIDVAAAAAGDILCFRWRAGLPAKHLGVLTSRRSMIHAIEGAAVCEIELSAWWWRHAAAAFAFPAVSP
jgi:NlpC/P60 family putative phage cell wall peptidase